MLSAALEPLDVNAYYALGVPLYLAAMVVEHIVMRRRGRNVYGVARTIGNVSGGLGEVLIGLLVGPALVALYDWGFRTCSLVTWPEGSVVPWVLAIVGSDLCYYVYHRAGHRFGLLWAIHGVHHQAEELNLSVALRHPWLADTYAWVFYFPLPLLGVPTVPFFAANAIISWYALTVHSRTFNRPGLGILVTPATHIVHHSKNPRYIGKNLGAMLTVWDRLFGTHVDLDPADPPELGTPAGYETHDGALSQWVFFRDLFAMARRGRTWRERLGVLLGRPGARPPGVPPAPRRPPAREESAVPPATRVYATVQLGLTLALSLWVMWWREEHPVWLLAGAAALALWSLGALGGLLDGRPGCVRHEQVRLLVTGGLGMALALTTHPIAGLVAAVASGASVAALAVLRTRLVQAPAG